MLHTSESITHAVPGAPLPKRCDGHSGVGGQAGRASPWDCDGAAAGGGMHQGAGGAGGALPAGEPPGDRQLGRLLAALGPRAVGTAVRRHWPEEGGWFTAAITAYLPATGAPPPHPALAAPSLLLLHAPRHASASPLSPHLLARVRGCQRPCLPDRL